MSDTVVLTPELMLRAYAVGIFPMAEAADGDRLYWFDPQQRGILPIEHFHIPRRLRRTVRQRVFDVRIDTAFAEVIDACAAATPDRPKSWINGAIRDACIALHRLGFAHSVEAWHGGRLVGGLYGVALGQAFFGESMFSRAADASKVALVHLVARLKSGGFTLLDTQFVTEHLAQFGALEVPRATYRRRLAAAVAGSAEFSCGDEDRVLSALLQSSTHTS